MSCSVCYEVTNDSSSLRGRVKCESCDFIVCRSCVQTYLVSILKEPQCMSCRNTWSHEYLETHLQRKYMDKIYSKHRGVVLLSQERQHFEKTRLYMKHSLDLKNMKSKLEAARVVLDALIVWKQQLQLKGHIPKRIQRKIKNQKEELETIRQEKKRIFQKRNNLEYSSVTYCFTSNCGSILDSSHHCFKCAITWCMTCHQACNSDTHMCKEEDVRTIELLTHNTRQCPGCTACISKIDGCDQMFCVQCHVAFSWEKGTFVSGKIHNPHYYEYLRNRNGTIPREENNDNVIMNPDMIPFINMHVAFKKANIFIKNFRADIVNAFQTHNKMFPMRKILRTYLKCLHNVAEMIPYLSYNTSNMDIRILFINGNINEETIQNRLRLRENAYRNRMAIRTRLLSFQNDFEKFVQTIWTSSSDEEILCTIDAIDYLRKDVNEDLLFLSKSKKFKLRT